MGKYKKSSVQLRASSVSLFAIISYYTEEHGGGTEGHGGTRSFYLKSIIDWQKAELLRILQMLLGEIIGVLHFHIRDLAIF